MPKPAARLVLLLAAASLGAWAMPAWAGKQAEEKLAASVRNALHRSVSDAPPSEESFADPEVRDQWLAEMSRRLAKRVPDPVTRRELLATIHYEATRAGLDPQMVLGLIQIESGFGKYKVSKAGARGYMQVMPFWVDVIGNKEDNLFHLRTNLRYGCTILRHYLDLEKGDLFLALGRYNGSRGKPTYPNQVNRVWQKHWAWETPKGATLAAAALAQKPVVVEPPAALPAPVVAPIQTAFAAEAPKAPEKPKTVKAPPPTPVETPVAATPATPPEAQRIAMHTPGGRRDIVIVR